MKKVKRAVQKRIIKNKKNHYRVAYMASRMTTMATASMIRRKQPLWCRSG